MNETVYRGFRIVPTFPVPPIPGWQEHATTWVHADYDGPGDNRIGTDCDEDACRAAIDDYIDNAD